MTDQEAIAWVVAHRGTIVCTTPGQYKVTIESAWRNHQPWGYQAGTASAQSLQDAIAELERRWAQREQDDVLWAQLRAFTVPRNFAGVVWRNGPGDQYHLMGDFGWPPEHRHVSASGATIDELIDVLRQHLE